MNDQINNFVATLRSLFTGRRDEKGASAVEYGLLVAGIAAVIVVIVFGLGKVINNAFDKTNNCVNSNGTNCTVTTP